MYGFISLISFEIRGRDKGGVYKDKDGKREGSKDWIDRWQLLISIGDAKT